MSFLYTGRRFTKRNKQNKQTNIILFSTNNVLKTLQSLSLSLSHHLIRFVETKSPLDVVANNHLMTDKICSNMQLELIVVGHSQGVFLCVHVH